MGVNKEQKEIIRHQNQETQRGNDGNKEIPNTLVPETQQHDNFSSLRVMSLYMLLKGVEGRQRTVKELLDFKNRKPSNSIIELDNRENTILNY